MIRVIDHFEGLNRTDSYGLLAVSGLKSPGAITDLYAVINRNRPGCASTICWRFAGACAEHGKGDEETGPYGYHFVLHCLSLSRLELDPVLGALIQNDCDTGIPRPVRGKQEVLAGAQRDELEARVLEAVLGIEE